MLDTGPRCLAPLCRAAQENRGPASSAGRRGVWGWIFRDGGLADAVTLKLEDGLSWTMGGGTGRTRTEKDIGLWKVARGAAGRGGCR